MQNLNSSEASLLGELQLALQDPLQARTRCRDLVSQLLARDPAGLAAVARQFLEAPGGTPGDYPCDETADAMMEADPRSFEAPVAAAAEACPALPARFRMTRAVFRRFPGRYRERMLEVGREVLAGEDPGAEAAIWLVRKFGAELAPDLVDFMRRGELGAERAAVLQEVVRVLGPGAVPVARAALGSSCEALEEAAHEALQRLGDPGETC